MNGMLCRACGARFYSAAANVLVERGDACPECGGELELVEGVEPPPEGARVGRRDPSEAPEDAPARRFRRG